MEGRDVDFIRNRTMARGKEIWNEAGGDSEGRTIEVFHTTLQVLFYFQKAKKSPWVGGGL